MSGDFFDISGETVRSADAAAEFRMVEPTTARPTKGGGKAWSEHGVIISASSETAEKEMEGGKKVPVLILKFQTKVGTLGSGLNKDYVVDTSLRLNKYALTNGANAPKGSPLQRQYAMSRMNVSRLKQLMRGVGVEPDMEDGGFSQGLQEAAFPKIGDFAAEPSFLINQEIWFEVKQELAENPDTKKKFWRIEITSVMPKAAE